ncbi:hypothetical protein GCM10023224_45350 [Streptomonospora halophila]|uniref:DUF2637 domain-containing protein n=1 Tax=Streptomonospora halophila TaxID=427369 RepID=A0ABP9GW79_9ACTN
MLALNAATVSFAHMFELALRHGEPTWRAAQFPISVDGMIIASSMALLNDARQGRRGGVLPWTLLIIGSAASLAANIAVADPTMWSRVIHAWPSAALIGSYELLMRQFRADTRAQHHTDPAMSAADQGLGSATAAEQQTSATATPHDGAQEAKARHLQVVETEPGSNPGEFGDIARADRGPPLIQHQAWTWALRHRRTDGTLPTGKEIAAAFGRRERWGRMVKQFGEAGGLGNEHVAAEHVGEPSLSSAGAGP